MASYSESLASCEAQQLAVRTWLVRNGFDPSDPRKRLRHPRERGWIIPHPRFPFGFQHFLDPHQQRERAVMLRVPWKPGSVVPLIFEQRALHTWKTHMDGNLDCTGSVLWRASQVLSDYLMIKWSSPTSLRQPLVSVELGCGGCPLPSLAAAACGHRVVATDLPSQLTLARVNLERNRKSLASVSPPPSLAQEPDSGEPSALLARSVLRPVDVTIAALPWGEELPRNEWWAEPGAVDLVIASDILYALPGKPVLFRELASTLKLLLKPRDRSCESGRAEEAEGASQAAKRTAIFSYQHRSGVERRFFEEVLPSEGFVCTDVTDHALSLGAGASLALGAVSSPSSPGGMMRGLIRLVEVHPK